MLGQSESEDRTKRTLIVDQVREQAARLHLMAKNKMFVSKRMFCSLTGDGMQEIGFRCCI